MGTLSRNTGVTLIELTITMAILAIVLAAVSSIFLSTEYTYQASVLKTEIETYSRRALALMTEELQNADLDTFVPMPDAVTGTKKLAFKKIESFAGIAAVCSTEITYELQYGDGETSAPGDENKNGLVNEMVLVRIQDDQTVRLASFLRQDGLRFLLDGSRLTIRFELERVTGRRELESSYAEKTILLRNKGICP